MNRTKAIVALAATLMSTAAISAPASAQVETFTFPASMCQPTSSQDADKLSFGGTSVRNTSNNNAQIICPIPGNTDISKVSAIVRVLFKPGFPSFCNLRSLNRDSTTFEISTTSPTSDGKELVTGSVRPGDTYTLTCVLTPGSQMFNYRFFGS
ncbi:MAG: hypothetical protein KME17_22485 [Cyanosarcina radialis HA8281-LM2]|jgi:hypothetical protein|nr:hypothetical protein [Cyanosarcina radialis HA8281-LM2]